MIANNQAAVKATFKLGDNDDNLMIVLPSVLACHGRIKHEQMWEYLGQLEKSMSKKVVVTQLSPGNEDADTDLIAMLTYFSSRKRCGVLGGSGNHGMKDMYVVPVPADEPLHPLLSASSWLKGPGFTAEREDDILLAIFVANSTVKKKSSQPSAKRSSSSSSSSHAQRSSPKHHKTSPSYLRTSPSYGKTPDYMLSPAGKTPDADDDALDRPYSPSQDDGLLDRPYSPSGGVSSSVFDDRPYSPSADITPLPTAAYGRQVDEAAKAKAVASAAGDNAESLFDMLETLNQEPPAPAPAAQAPAMQAPRAAVQAPYQAPPASTGHSSQYAVRPAAAASQRGEDRGSSGPPSAYGGGYGSGYGGQQQPPAQHSRSSYAQPPPQQQQYDRSRPQHNGYGQPPSQQYGGGQPYGHRRDDQPHHEDRPDGQQRQQHSQYNQHQHGQRGSEQAQRGERGRDDTRYRR